MKTRTKGIAVAAVVTLALAITACNPTNETVPMTDHGSSQSYGTGRLYSYTGDAPGWIQVRVASSPAETVKIAAETQQRSGPTYCIQDGAYGTDVLLTSCPRGISIGDVSSPYRAAQTEGISRGWKKLIAIPGKTRFMLHVSQHGVANTEDTKLEFSVVDGNGNPIGDIIVSEGVG